MNLNNNLPRLVDFDEIFIKTLRQIRELLNPERVKSELRGLDLSEAKKQVILSNCQGIYGRAIDIDSWPKGSVSSVNSSPLENIVRDIKPLTSSKLYHHFRDKKINNLTKLLNHLQIDKYRKPKKSNRLTLNDFSINIAGSYLRRDSFVTELIRAELKDKKLPLFFISFEEFYDISKDYGNIKQNIRILMIVIIFNYFLLGGRSGIYNLHKNKNRLMSLVYLFRQEEFISSRWFLEERLGFGAIVKKLYTNKPPINIASIIKAGGMF